ncbi:MAG: membrane protein insertase YidC [Prevotella sp.]|nr:membrane protein insertase YidC [Prevotella sp.]
MDKNNIIGFILIALVFIGFSWYNQPSQEEIIAAQKQDSIANVQRMNAEQAQKKAEAEKQAAIVAAKEDSTSLFFPSLSGKEESVVLKNNKLQLAISTKGAALKTAKILGFESRDGKSDVTLFDGKEQKMNFMLAGKTLNILTNDLYFTPSNVTDTTVTMAAQAQNGGSLVMKYTLGKDYMLRMSMQANGLSGVFAPNYDAMDVVWTEQCRQQEKGFMFENRYCTLTYKEKDGSTDYLNETSEKVDENVDTQLDWVAFKTQFFSAVFIPKSPIAANSKMTSMPYQKQDNTGYLKYFEAKMKTAFDPTGKQPSEFEMYIGPNDYRLLQRMNDESVSGKDLELQELVYLGWPIVRWINRWFTLYVFDWLTGFGLNMGIVLIIITLLLKAITFPLVKKSYMSSAKMRVLKPKLEEATKQYDKPEDAMQKQQAMMQLYSQYGVSPLGGCLPMLIQMPIWVAMFNFVPNAIQLRGQSFLWISDLSTYDPIVEWNTNIWLIGDHLSLTCILFCVSNVLYSVMTMRQQRDQMVGQQAEQMKMMQWMTYLMPVMFFFMFNDYSAGLNFYYFVSLFFSAAIMWTLRKTTNDEKLLAKLEERYKENKANPKKQSGLAARLAAMQKEAEELRKQRNGQFGK